MLNRRALSNLGSRVYGVGAVALGLVGLVWLPRVAGYPHIFATWGGFLEEMALVVADSMASRRQQTQRQESHEALAA